MNVPDASDSPRYVVPHLRWWIGALLFASTVINYIDRQTLNVLAPYLKAEYRWTNSDFALIVIAFRVSYAVVQLRQDNALGTLFNIVGFQTKLKYGEQGRIFRMIPGLENAEFARLGGIHRNTYLN